MATEVSTIPLLLRLNICVYTRMIVYDVIRIFPLRLQSFFFLGRYTHCTLYCIICFIFSEREMLGVVTLENWWRSFLSLSLFIQCTSTPNNKTRMVRICEEIYPIFSAHVNPSHIICFSYTDCCSYMNNGGGMPKISRNI